MSKSQVKQNNNKDVISSEDWLEAMRKAAEKAPPQIRPYELLDSLDFSYPDKSDEQKEKILNIAENNAEFLYSFLKSQYNSRNEEVFQEAINALDQMKEKYMMLKAKKPSINE